MSGEEQTDGLYWPANEVNRQPGRRLRR
ncbi:hypothetical protein [Mesorhizobium sp. WSM2239]|uniref:Uncharacterized protein n=2 Tax=unclassified Mesorhizobium TaxID=325217 RepID=A0AAU8DI02_9HYPH